MKRSICLALAALFSSGFVTVWAADAMMDMGAAKTLFETKCSHCHEKERPLSTNKDHAGWEETVKRMQGKQAGWISDADAKSIIEYLAHERGMKK